MNEQQKDFERLIAYIMIIFIGIYMLLGVIGLLIEKNIY